MQNLYLIQGPTPAPKKIITLCSLCCFLFSKHVDECVHSLSPSLAPSLGQQYPCCQCLGGSGFVPPSLAVGEVQLFSSQSPSVQDLCAHRYSVFLRKAPSPSPAHRNCLLFILALANSHSANLECKFLLLLEGLIQEETASSCTRVGLDRIFGKISSPKGLSSTGTGCPGKWLSHRP